MEKKKFTNIAKARRGRYVLVSLPEGDPTGARAKIRLAVQNKEINLQDGDSVDKILATLDKCFKKDDLGAASEAYFEYINYKRASGQKMADYINESDKKIAQLKRRRIILPEIVLAMQLLHSSGLPKHDQTLVKTAVDLNDISTLYDQMKQGLRKYFGDMLSPLPEDKPPTTAISIKPAGAPTAAMKTDFGASEPPEEEIVLSTGGNTEDMQVLEKNILC